MCTGIRSTNKNERASGAERAGFWTISAPRFNGRKDEVFLLRRADYHILPLFSFEEEAQLYLRYGLRQASAGEWRVAKSSREEISHLLKNTRCAGAKYVALDPVPEFFDDDESLRLTSLRREVFLNRVVGSSRRG